MKATASYHREHVMSSIDGTGMTFYTSGEAPKHKDLIYANPQQLLALAYSACFLNTMHIAANMFNINLPIETSVSAYFDNEEFATDRINFNTKIIINIPGTQEHIAHSIVHMAYEKCPYSAATLNGIDFEFIINTTNCQ